MALGSSRTDKRLAWRSQGQLQWRLRFCTKLLIKRIHNTHTHTHLWRILRYKSIIDKVSLKLHKASYKTFCLNTVNFFSVCDKCRLQTCRWTRQTLLWNALTDSLSPNFQVCPIIMFKWLLARQTNTLHGCFLILTTLPASKLIDCYSYNPSVYGIKS